jgi:hypothetical protein
MDFNRNPGPVPGDQAFSLDRLDADVATYLGTAGATQALPIDRQRHMNPLAIELYRRYKIDIAAEPLEFAVNNQHMNGGIAVDTWGRTSLPGAYAVGEAAGTHGVTRPGGAALNAGQVFGTRVAEHIAAGGRAVPPASNPRAAEAAVAGVADALRPGSPLSVRTVRAAVQARMSDHAGMICDGPSVAAALAEAHALNADLRARGIAFGRPAEAARALQWQQTALASEAVLTALDHYIRSGGGSRGARAILDDAGSSLPTTPEGPLEAYRFRAERDADRGEQLLVRRRGDGFTVEPRPNRSFDEEARSFFERDWPDWLTGRVYDLEAGRG